MTSEPIAEFRGRYYFLSNFFSSRVEIPIMGAVWVFPTAEHTFQAAKALAVTGVSDAEREKHIADVLRQPTPGRAKMAGRRIPMDVVLWDKISADIMLRVLRAKFSVPTLRTALIETGDAHLEEGNYWGDTVWGTVNGVGENRLGKILMQVRSELQP